MPIREITTSIVLNLCREIQKEHVQTTVHNDDGSINEQYMVAFERPSFKKAVL